MFACVDVHTGEIEWRQRGFERASLLQAGDRTILLDVNGELALARLNPGQMTLLAQATISEGPTWTIPTLVGTTLFVRDQKSLRAFDLGR